MAEKKTQFVQYMCSNCGAKAVSSVLSGRPSPGVCPRALIKGRPHRWVVNRRF